MHILLDTHIFLWWLKDDGQLSQKARLLITDADAVFLSSVSIWEAAIKMQLGKLNVEIDALVNAIESEGFSELPFTTKHAAQVSRLPPHHRDPFDRALVAQAICEPLRLITSDLALKSYSELVEIV